MPANTQRKGNKGKANKTTWRKGIPSPNPVGHPKDGQSWREIIAEVSNMTVEDLLLIVGEKSSLGKTIKQMPRLVQMKYLVTIRVMTALMLEPTAGLWNGLMDRMEGKVTEVVQVSRQLEIEGLYEMIEKVYGEHKE
jgi:hypothetical protein